MVVRAAAAIAAMPPISTRSSANARPSEIHTTVLGASIFANVVSRERSVCSELTPCWRWTIAIDRAWLSRLVRQMSMPSWERSLAHSRCTRRSNALGSPRSTPKASDKPIW